VPLMSKGSETRSKILDFLAKAGPSGVSAIAAGTGLTLHAVRHQVKHMHKRGGLIVDSIDIEHQAAKIYAPKPKQEGANRRAQNS